MLEVKTKRVCRSCNNGWMASLDNDAKPVLSRMVRGERCLLDPSEQVLVSTWALKAALMSELIWPDRDSVIPSEHYEYIHEHSRPPESSRIWCGAHWPTPFDGRFAAAFEHAYQLHFESDGDPHIGYTVMVGIGHVAFQVLGHTGPGEFDIGSEVLDRPVDDFLRRTWPAVETAVEWPPPMAFTYDGLQHQARPKLDPATESALGPPELA